MNIKELIDQDRLVKVTAADFNGKDSDGSPLEAVKPGGDLQWVIDAKPKIEARGSTDYAWFGCTGEGIDLTWAGPGDYLFNTLNKSYPIAVIPRLAMEALLKESKPPVMLQKSTREGYFTYDNRTYSDREIQMLTKLAKGAATPLELYGQLGGATQNSIVKGLGNLRVGGLVRESDASGFARAITPKGLALLASNPTILPAG